MERAEHQPLKQSSLWGHTSELSSAWPERTNRWSSIKQQVLFSVLSRKDEDLVLVWCPMYMQLIWMQFSSGLNDRRRRIVRGRRRACARCHRWSNGALLEDLIATRGRSISDHHQQKQKPVLSPWFGRHLPCRGQHRSDHDADGGHSSVGRIESLLIALIASNWLILVTTCHSSKRHDKRLHRYFHPPNVIHKT